jgi:putative ABC transport system permease protein
VKAALALAAAFLRQYPVRVVLTSIATAAATCVVIWCAGGYEALLRSFDEYANKALGRYTLSVAPISASPEAFVPPEVVEELRADSAVAAAEPMWAQPISARAETASAAPPAPAPGRRAGNAGGPGGPPRGFGPQSSRPATMLLGTDAPDPPFAILRGRWLDPRQGAALEAAAAAGAARQLGVDLGDTVVTGEGETALRLTIAGIVDAPVIAGPAGGTAVAHLPSPGAGGLYVPVALAERIVGRTARASFVGVVLEPDADITAFRFGWAPRLSRFAVPAQFQEAHDIEEALDESAAAENARLWAVAATGIALLVAFLVIFCTMSMGVSERARQYAMLRAVALTRLQIGSIVALEGLLLATIGFLLGTASGQVLLWIAASASHGIFRHGAAAGAGTIALAALPVYAGAALASLVPIFRAVRLRPVDAMAPPPGPPLGKISLAPAAAGLLLCAVNPLLTFLFPPGFGVRVVASLVVGWAALAAGLVLITPAAVAAVDRFASPALARMFGLRPQLLAGQITGNLWRTAGAALTLTVGLGLFIAVQVWGFTMLDSFVPGPWAPDALLSFGPDGIPPRKAAAVAAFPGVDPERCLPLVVEQPRLRDDLTHSAKRASITRQDNVVIVGLDPEQAFAGARPLLQFDWVEGSPRQAADLLEKGRACIVPDHFLRETGLALGDSFQLIPPENPARSVTYVVAGSVRLPGWHWLTKQTGFRTRTHRAAALVFADYASVARDFGLENASHVWLSYASAPGEADRIVHEARALLQDHLQREVSIGAAPGGAPHVRLISRADIQGMVRAAARRALWMISVLPLIALAIVCLGAINVILASMRARRWSMGVLRALGFTRGTLLRLVIAEGVLIGIVACALSLGFGVIAGWCGRDIAQYTSFFGGMHPALVIPWIPVGLGMLAVLLLAALCAVPPAVSLARAEPTALLQPGRGSF